MCTSTRARARIPTAHAHAHACTAANNNNNNNNNNAHARIHTRIHTRIHAHTRTHSHARALRYLSHLPDWLLDDPRGVTALLTTTVLRNVLWLYPPFHVAKGYHDVAAFAAYNFDFVTQQCVVLVADVDRDDRHQMMMMMMMMMMTMVVLLLTMITIW
jgi:hypothetical protein